MASHPIWKTVFTQWPATIPRRGVLVSTLNETTPFKGFLVKDDILLLERTNPDPLGARFILIGFEAIHCVKFIDPLKESVFTGTGYVGKLSNT
jgi:hypothetical protein